VTPQPGAPTRPGPSGDRDPTYCEVGECEEETEEGRRYCPLHTKRHQRGKRGAELSAPKAARLPPAERALELVGQLVEAPAEDDREYDRRRRKALGACKELGLHEVRESIRRGMEAAKAKGVHVGRPRKLAGDEERARTLVKRLGVTGAAEVLEVHRNTLAQFLAAQKGSLSGRRQEARPAVKGLVHAGR
jgi:hypothetical protein